MLLLLIARRLIPRTTPVGGVVEPPSKEGAMDDASVAVVAEIAAPFPSSVSIVGGHLRVCAAVQEGQTFFSRGKSVVRQGGEGRERDEFGWREKGD